MGKSGGQQAIEVARAKMISVRVFESGRKSSE